MADVCEQITERPIEFAPTQKIAEKERKQNRCGKLIAHGFVFTAQHFRASECGGKSSEVFFGISLFVFSSLLLLSIL